MLARRRRRTLECCTRRGNLRSVRRRLCGERRLVALRVVPVVQPVHAARALDVSAQRGLALRRSRARFRVRTGLRGVTLKAAVTPRRPVRTRKRAPLRRRARPSCADTSSARAACTGCTTGTTRNATRRRSPQSLRRTPRRLPRRVQHSSVRRRRRASIEAALRCEPWRRLQLAELDRISARSPPRSPRIGAALYWRLAPDVTQALNDGYGLRCRRFTTREGCRRWE